MEQIRLTRRSIYNPKLAVVGYELGFYAASAPDSSEENEGLSFEQFSMIYEQENLASTLNHEFNFIDFSVAMLRQDPPDNLPKEKIIVMLDEQTISVDADLMQRIQRLRGLGFRFAACGSLLLSELGEFAQQLEFIKINTAGITHEEFMSRFEEAKKFPAKVIAANISNHNDFNFFQEQKIPFFEGNFMSIPNLENKHKVSTNRIVTLRLLAALDDPDISAQEVEELLSHDAKLSYKLLRVVNSAAFSMPRTISSLREAIVFLGLRQIREWAGMIVLSSVEEKPSELMRITLTRAKMAETLADICGESDVRGYFTVGLFSTLDALLDREIHEVLQELPLAEEFKTAIADHEGVLGSVLENIVFYERGDWEHFDNCGIDDNHWMQAYLQGVNWANQSLSSMK